MTELEPPTMPIDMTRLAPTSRDLHEWRVSRMCHCDHCRERELQLSQLSDSGAADVRRRPA